MPKPKYWLQRARSDLSLAKKGAQGDDTLDSAIYHTQQCAEKSFKAYLVAREYQFKRTHDLVVLLQHCMQLDDSFIVLRKESEQLNPFSTMFRYPDDCQGVPERDLFMKALEQAEKVFLFVREKIEALETGQQSFFD